MYCSQCGEKISDNARFCQHCGTLVSCSTENQQATENTVPPYRCDSNSMAGLEKKAINSNKNLSELSNPSKRKKLKLWQKTLIGIGGFIAGLALLFVIFILIPAIRCVNTYEAISPYLDYVGDLHPDDDEPITLTQEEYDNMDNIKFMGMKGEVSFNAIDGYIASCTWTSFDFCTEDKYREFADDLCIYFETEPSVEAKSYGNGNTYRYSWVDPYYGFSVTMAHGFFAYDPDGRIEIKWEVSEESCGIIGHTWIAATCTDRKTCDICGATEGTALGHSLSDWSDWDIDYDKAVNIREQSCTKCEEVVETQEQHIASFVDGVYFTIYPNAFANRFEESSSRLNGIDYCTKSEYTYDMPTYHEDNKVYYRIQDKNDDYSDLGIMSFTDPNGETISAMNEYTESCFDCINILIEESYDVSAVVYSALLAIDPDIGYSEAADVGQRIVDSIAIAVGDLNEEDFQGITHNGINYLLYRDREYHYLIVTIATK